MRAYSFKNTILLVNGVEITGFADGDDVISMKRRSNLAEDEVGADGNMMVSISADHSGEISIKLQQTSSSNKYLMSLANLQEGGGSRFIPVQLYFQDTYRNDIGSGSIGYISKQADMTRGKKGQTHEWVFIVERLDLLCGDPLLKGSFIKK